MLTRSWRETKKTLRVAGLKQCKQEGEGGRGRDEGKWGNAGGGQPPLHAAGIKVWGA